MSETVIIGPDGARYVFPAGVTPEKMREAMRRRYRRGEYYQRMDQGREMIMGSNVRNRSEAQMEAGQYLAEDQLRQDIEAGRQQARAEEMIAAPDIGRERFMTAAQGLTLGAAPYLQGGAQGLAAGAMFPFLSPEQRERLGGPNIGDVVGEQASRGYQTARADIERAREARPLESLGLELVGGFGAIKSIYDDIGQRYFRNQAGVRGGISGAGGGAQYGILESEGSPEETALAASIGGIGGAGIAKALQATAGPVGRMFNRMTGRQVEPVTPEPVMEPPEPGGGYFGRQSMRAARDRGPSERVLAMQADWAPVQPNMGNARAAANAAGRLAQEATNLRGADRQTTIERASNAIQAVRRQVQDIQAQRAGMATPEDQRLQDIIDLLEPTNDPVLLQTQATMVQQNLARINQAIGLEEVPRSMPPQQSAARRLGFQPTVRDETAVARERPIAGRYAGARDDTTPQGFAVPNAFVEAGAGSIGGSVAGQQYDITGDGVIDERDVQAGALLGMAGVPAIGAAARRMGRNAMAQGDMQTMGIGGPSAPVASQTAEPFYSGLQRAITQLKPEKATAEQWKGMLNNAPGVKKEELEWTGVLDWLDAQEGQVSKADLDAYVQANGVQVEEVLKGGQGVSEELQQELLPLIELKDKIARSENFKISNDGQIVEPDWISKRSYNQQINELDRSSEFWVSYERMRNSFDVAELKDLLDEFPSESDRPIWAQDSIDTAIERISQDVNNLNDDLENYKQQLQFRIDELQKEEGVQWSNYTLLGGENYSELLLTLPKGPRYKSDHWNEPNVLAHVRFKDRTGPNGERILAMEEIQSDWHQAGRKQGYGKSVPDAPFKNEGWINLALNRMIRKAAEEGYDGISWIPGNVQNGSIVTAADNRGDFYDKIVVNAANKIGKKYGAKATRLDGVAKTKEGQPVNLHYLPITPEMKNKALQEGFPLFAGLPFAVGGAGLGMGAMQEEE